MQAIGEIDDGSLEVLKGFAVHENAHTVVYGHLVVLPGGVIESEGILHPRASAIDDAHAQSRPVRALLALQEETHTFYGGLREPDPVGERMLETLRWRGFGHKKKVMPRTFAVKPRPMGYDAETGETGG